MDILWRKGAVWGHVASDLTCFSGELEVVVSNGQVWQAVINLVSAFQCRMVRSLLALSSCSAVTRSPGGQTPRLLVSYCILL
jgi:hypothetical protein